MPIVNRIAEFHDEMTAWRRDLHAHPETCYEEVRTSAFVAEKLKSWGIEVHTGMAKTGVVGVLQGARGPGPAIGLRADMDALPMQEINTFAHASQTPGRMHACGHDGHTTMLLGAARYLAETRNFAGTAVFIFQPAEEGGGGGLKMIQDGLFERFPVEQVYGMHNWPQLPVGTVAVRSGPMMAAADHIDITVRGRGTHAAMPHLGIDPVVVASHIITALQSLVSRQTNPLDSAVISITRINAGSAYNVIPAEATLAGTVRTFSPTLRASLEADIGRVASHVAQAFGATAELSYWRGYPPTINDAGATERAALVAEQIVGADNVVWDAEPSMGAEDFSYMLERKPGSYIWLGQGGSEDGRTLHNTRYDFNDEILPLGASYWSRLVETLLA